MEIYAAGAIAAFTVDVLVYPLDTLKTRYQSQDYMKTYAPGSSNKPLALRGLYQGLGSVILATLPAAGLFFSTYEGAKTVFGRSLPLPDPLIHSSASAVAEMASCLVLAPAEVIKQNAQMFRGQSEKQRIEGSTSLRAYRDLGGAGTAQRLFRGYTALIARNLPFTALQFPVFEHLRSRIWEERRRGEANRPQGLLETGVVTACSAGGAGAIAAFVTTPSDVVKTRMMLTAGSSESSNESKVARSEVQSAQKGAWAITKDVYRERGIRGLFRGGLFRSAWTAFGSGLYLGTYDVAKVWLKRRNPDLDDTVGL